jgi:hypothetical protein
LLLLANLGMFVWLLTQPEPQQAQYRPAPVPPGIEPLVLLSERSPGQPPDAGDDALKQETTDTQVVEQPPADAVVSGEDEAGPAEVASADQTGPEPDAGNNGEGEQADAAPERFCQTVGPFMKEAVSADIGKRLAALGYQPTHRTAEARTPSGYWIYMPAMPAAEARRIVAELDAHGMTDYFIGKQNYISLGIFSRKSKARVRLEQIQGLGFDAILDRRYRTRTVYWIDIVQGDKPPLLGSEIWSEIQAQHTDIRVQNISCE